MAKKGQLAGVQRAAHLDSLPYPFPRLPYAAPWSGGLRSRQGKGTERFMDSDFLDASSLPDANRAVPQLLHGMEPVFLR